MNVIKTLNTAGWRPSGLAGCFGDYSRRKRRQFFAEFGDSRRFKLSWKLQSFWL